MYTPTAQLVTYFNNLRNQKITLVAVPPLSGWQHSSDDGRVVTEDMTLRPFRATVVATRHVETFISFSSISLVSPGFLYLHASSLPPVNVFHRRHNTTGNNGGGQIKRAAKRMADTRKHRPWKLNLKRCVFGMSTCTSKIEIPAGFCRANNWTVSTTTRERWREVSLAGKRETKRKGILRKIRYDIRILGE